MSKPNVQTWRLNSAKENPNEQHISAHHTLVLCAHPGLAMTELLNLIDEQSFLSSLLTTDDPAVRLRIAQRLDFISGEILEAIRDMRKLKLCQTN